MIKSPHYLVLRYTSLLLLARVWFYTGIFSKIILTLTLYPVNFILNISFNSSIVGSTILIDNYAISIIPACLALSAYFLLIALNLLTPMKPKQRIYSLIFTIGVLWLFNLARIVFMAIAIIQNYPYFNQIHNFFWLFLSTVLIIGIWFASVRFFKIRAIPIYSDIRKALGKKR